jgi:predicted Abi (CAAX) family protease
MAVSYPMKRTLSRIFLPLLSLGAIALSAFLFSPQPVGEIKADYWITSRLAVNQPGCFPLEQPLDPQWYRPIAGVVENPQALGNASEPDRPLKSWWE